MSRPGHPLLLPRENGRPLDRHTVTRFINKAGAAAGPAHIHPHQLRHTLATQAINRGMSLEAIAALLGHRSLDMTLRYAKIASRTVADEYFAVTEKVEALYGQPAQLPADAVGPKMARLRREHHRLLGNGWCTRPPQLDCAFESICETCTYFQTSIEFRPALAAQHDDAAAKSQAAARNSSPGSSTRSTTPRHHDQLDNDHPHNAADRAITRAPGCQGAPAGTTISAALGICPPQPLSEVRNVTDRDRESGCGRAGSAVTGGC